MSLEAAFLNFLKNEQECRINSRNNSMTFCQMLDRIRYAENVPYETFAVFSITSTNITLATRPFSTPGSSRKQIRSAY